MKDFIFGYLWEVGVEASDMNCEAIDYCLNICLVSGFAAGFVVCAVCAIGLYYFKKVRS